MFLDLSLDWPKYSKCFERSKRFRPEGYRQVKWIRTLNKWHEEIMIFQFEFNQLRCCEGRDKSWCQKWYIETRGLSYWTFNSRMDLNCLGSLPVWWNLPWHWFKMCSKISKNPTEEFCSICFWRLQQHLQLCFRNGKTFWLPQVCARESEAELGEARLQRPGCAWEDWTHFPYIHVCKYQWNIEMYLNFKPIFVL